RSRAVSDLAGTVAWVAGAARPPGIGRATAIQLARLGADIACVDVVDDMAAPEQSYRVPRAALEETAAAVRAEGRRALVLPVELADPEAVDAAVTATVDALGRVDISCNLSGGTGPALGTSTLLDVTPESFRDALDANLTATWLGARACARQMIVQGGSGAIVNLASSAALAGEPRFGAFAAARAGVVRLTEVLALELAEHGIRANAVCPLGVSPNQGAGNPGLTQGRGRSGGDADDWARRAIPLGRFQEPEETASVIVFLASGESSFVTGQSITVAGGVHV
ncbi:MAG: SDR family oxidoreductase, partial [Acidimicrobiia bacterium]